MGYSSGIRLNRFHQSGSFSSWICVNTTLFPANHCYLQKSACPHFTGHPAGLVESFHSFTGGHKPSTMQLSIPQLSPNRTWSWGRATIKLGNTSRKGRSMEEAMRDPSFLLAKYFSAPMSCKQPPPMLCQPPNSLVSQSELGNHAWVCGGSLSRKARCFSSLHPPMGEKVLQSDKPCQVPVKCV